MNMQIFMAKNSNKQKEREQIVWSLFS